MKKQVLLCIAFLASFYSHAAVVQGTVVNASNTPVVNQIVHVTDSSNGVQIFSLQDTTDASGNYSITIPSNTANGSLLHVFTEKCGVKHTSLQSYTGSNISVNFTVCGSTTCSGDTVSGKVTLASTTTPAYPATVYLVKKSYNSTSNAYVLTLLDSASTSSNGEYHFYCLTTSAGDLLVKAALTASNSSYSSYLPTYKENSLTWSGAHPVSFTLGANNIHMVGGTNNGGPGFIGGSVLMGANRTTGVGDPLSQRIILLTTINDDGVAYTYSDAAGKFSFGNLAYGTYKLFGDVWGKNNPATIVTVNAGTPSVNNIVFEENGGSFGALAVSQLAVLGDVSVYPNPVQHELNISGLNKIDGVKTITLLSVTGSKILSQATTDNTLKLPMEQLAAGCYLLQIKTNAGTASYQIMK